MTDMTVETGKTYRTEGGHDVCIYATDRGGLFPVHGAVRSADGSWILTKWEKNGVHSNPSRWTLVEVKPVQVRYVNFYRGGGAGGGDNHTRKQADAVALGTGFRIACVRVPYTEGQFDD